MEKFNRKDFLKLAGGTVGGAVAGGAVGATLSGAPFLSVQWVVEWTQDQYVPQKGVDRYINSMYGTYPGGSEVTARMIEDRAVKINTTEENADAQLVLQMLYHPERIKTPLKRTGKKGFGKYKEVTWEEAVKDISSKVDELIKNNKSKSIAAIDSGKGGLPSLLIERFVNSAGSPNIYFEPSFELISSKAVEMTQNVKGVIQYDIQNSDYILSFGARIYEDWNQPKEVNRAIKTWDRTKVRHTHIDSMSTRTASMADKWVPVKAGTEPVLAMGIANQLIKMGKRASGKGFAGFLKLAEKYTPQEVSKITGVNPAAIKKLAEELASARNPVAVAGRGSCEVSSQAAEIMAVQCLNALVNSIGKKGGVFVKGMPSIGRIKEIDGGKAGVDDFINKGNDFDLLFINEANPVHKSVHGKKLIEKMQKASMVVSIAPLINDTVKYSDYILPSLTSLEMENKDGEIPVSPRYKSLFSGDAIMKIAHKTRNLGKSFLWNNHLDAVKTMDQGSLIGIKKFSFPADILKKYLDDLDKKLMDSKAFPVAMIPFSLTSVGDGSGLALPYTLKGIDDTVILGKNLWVQMNPETAEKYGLCQGSKIELTSNRGSLGGLKVHITKTVAPDVIAVPLGFGQADNTKYASEKGVNPKEIMSDDIDPVSGIADWWLTKVKIS